MKSRQRPGVVFQPRVYRAFQRGITTLVNAIRPTLGPLSGGVAIDPLSDARRLPEYLDDGGTIARRIIELANRDEDAGAMLLRSMLVRQHEQIGDGTATAAVLFEAIFNAGLRYIAAGGNAMQMRRYLEGTIPLLWAELDRMVKPLTGTAALTSLARSVCHEDKLADKLGDAFNLLGQYGRLEVREGYGRELHNEYVDGTYFNTGLFSRSLLPVGQDTITLEDPLICIADHEVEDYHDLFPVLQTAHALKAKQLVIIIRSLSDKAVSLLVANNRMDTFKVIAVRLPGGTPIERMEASTDLAMLTGAMPLLTAAGEKLAQITEAHFGTARRLWAAADKFGLASGQGDPRVLRQHVALLQGGYHAATDPRERKRLLARLGTLLGGSVTLWVGGHSEPDINNRKNVAERAALAMRAALDEGVVIGGGLALAQCRHILDQQPITDSDQRAAYRALSEALLAPCRTIFRNAGYDPSAVLAELNPAQPEIGFDVVHGQPVNMLDAGIVDSAVMVKTCLRNAISTAAIALTVDSIVHLAKPEIIRQPT